jgi:zinc transport system substrate-binding protein
MGFVPFAKGPASYHQSRRSTGNGSAEAIRLRNAIIAMPCIWFALRDLARIGMVKKAVAHILAIVITLWAGVFAEACAAERLSVIADISPLASLARDVGGQRVHVSVLVPPGRDPHTFEVTPRQMAHLASARLFLSLDMPFARRLLPKLKNANPGLQVIDAAAGIERISSSPESMERQAVKGHKHGRGEPDPHVWLDPLRAIKIVNNIAGAFSTADPAGRDFYKANQERMRARLLDLHAKLKRILSPYEGREFYVFHPALGYLAQAYGLKQVPVQAGGKEPGAKRLALLIQHAREKGVRIIFVEPQFPQGTAKSIAKAIGGVVVVLDPLAPDYPANLENMAISLAQGLKQVKP